MLLLIVAAATALAAALHLFAVPEHMMGYMEGEVPGYLPLGFAVTAALGFVYLFALAPDPTVRLVRVGIVFNGAMLVAGAWSRLAGLPGAGREPITAPWAGAMLAETVALIALVIVLARFRDGLAFVRMPSWFALSLLHALALCVGFLLTGSGMVDHAKMLAGWIWYPYGWMIVLPNGWMI